jgi:hypothetical protein
MSWFKVRWTMFGRVGAALLITVLPAAQQAHAQSSGAPQEQTVAQLRATLEGIIGDDRQSQLLGIPPGGIDDVAIGLLESDFDENVQPGLDFAEKDCFFAEVPVGKSAELGAPGPTARLCGKHGATLARSRHRFRSRY